MVKKELETLGSIGERELINRIARYAPPGQLDDDTAILRFSPERSLVINNDVFVESIHFSDLTTRPRDIGWRITAATLSDLAATGCNEILGITVGLIAPAATSWGWVENVYHGLNACLSHYGGFLLGGDCSEGEERVLAITAFGKLGPGRLHRKDAKPGDWIIVSGPHGLSRLGLALLQNEIESNNIPFMLRQQAIRAHRRPNPRFDIVKNLEKVRPKNMPWRIGGIDSSDGLLESIYSLAKASSCQAKIEKAALPINDSMKRSFINNASKWVLSGGEDFELILSLSPSWAQALLDHDSNCRKIGIMVERTNCLVGWIDVNQELIENNYLGFQHFQ